MSAPGERHEGKFGGTAGNIAYSLRMLGENPIICATIGHDYQRYFKWLTKNGISTETLKSLPTSLPPEPTLPPTSPIIQITGFNPGAMKYRCTIDFNKFAAGETIVIVSPGNFDDMVEYPRACKAKGIDYILDPGQSLPLWDKNDLIQAIEGCRILIVNDYELSLIMSKTGLNKNVLLKMAGENTMKSSWKR